MRKKGGKENSVREENSVRKEVEEEDNKGKQKSVETWGRE